MRTRHVYDRQAETYDTTRGASPSVLGPLQDALKGAPGRELLDIGGGTGNYAVALQAKGWDPLVIDLNPAMLARAAAKGLRILQADAAALPVANAVADAVILISMLHHVPDWRSALEEARRVLRSGGRLALMCWTREHMERVTWLREYFPSMNDWLALDHASLAELQSELPGARFCEWISAMSRTHLSARSSAGRVSCWIPIGAARLPTSRSSNRDFPRSSKSA
jgi:ubiquinone/menaquinone biosynthesis C-methylase UbiE